MKRRRVETAVGFDRPAILAEFDHVFRHSSLRQTSGGLATTAILTAFSRPQRSDCQTMAFVLFTPYIVHETAGNARDRPPAMNRARRACTADDRKLPHPAQSGAADGQKLAFDRGKGNCLTCHEIKGGDSRAPSGRCFRYQNQIPGPQRSDRHRQRRDQAQSADRDAAIRAQPHSDREGNQRDRRFPANAVKLVAWRPDP